MEYVIIDQSRNFLFRLISSAVGLYVIHKKIKKNNLNCTAALYIPSFPLQSYSIHVGLAKVIVDFWADKLTFLGQEEFFSAYPF